MHTLLIATFLLLFAISFGAGILIFGRPDRPESITHALTFDDEIHTGLKRIQVSFTNLLTVVGTLERFIPKSKSDLSLAQKRLYRIGFRNESAANYFYGAKVVAILALVALVLALRIPHEHPILGCIVALLAGYGGPEIWLSMQLTRRKKHLRRGLPDFLDLLIVCMEAGLSLDQATVRTVDEMRKSKEAIADEVALVVLEQRAGITRMEAWKHMAERTDESAIRRVVSLLVQADQFGTSIAKTLRVHSESMRTERVQRIEEVTAKMSVKMLFPLVLLIFPSIFVVTMGPALILAFESFKNNLGN
jgi:tight adherence protein C